MNDNWNMCALQNYIYMANSGYRESCCSHSSIWILVSRYGQLQRMAIRHAVRQRPTMTPGQEAEEAKMSGPENNTAWYGQEKSYGSI